MLPRRSVSLRHSDIRRIKREFAHRLLASFRNQDAPTACLSSNAVFKTISGPTSLIGGLVAA